MRLSKQDFDAYQRLNSLATRVLCVTDLSDEAIMALARSTMHGRRDHLNALMYD
jgi:hypothetical protein